VLISKDVDFVRLPISEMNLSMLPGSLRHDARWLARWILEVVLVMTATVPASAEDAPRLTTLEVVTSDAAAGDGGNGWGGHQCRIVRTRDGVFTAYTVPGKDDMNREWRLAWRRDEQWKVIAGGLAGREPVNLLASPDGTLHVIGWPEGRARWWSGKPGPKTLALRDNPVPGLSEGHWPYGSAGIDQGGRICVLSSEGEKPGVFRWSMRDPQSGVWTPGAAALDYRHCYTYVFPGSGGGLSLVSTRDVRWETLGYTKPFREFDYVFNAFGYWLTPDAASVPLRRIASGEEKPTRRHPVVRCTAQGDAYLDSRNRMHVVYTRSGPSTDGEEEVRYGVMAPDGTPLADVKVPWATGVYCRVFQDERGQFYLLGSDGVIFSGGTEAVSFKKKSRLRLGRHPVEDAGFGISAPRTGTPPAQVMDFVYPAGGGTKWIYGRIVLHEAGGGGKSSR
jgi:hypothetical protein